MLMNKNYNNDAVEFSGYSDILKHQPMYLISWDYIKNSLYFSVDIIEHVAQFIRLKIIGAITSKI